MFTEEQLAALLSMPNISEEERAIARQQQFANQLRTGGLGSGANARLDKGSQIARAMSGIAGGMFANQANAASATAGEKQREFIQGLFNRRPAKTFGSGDLPEEGY